MSDLFEFRVVGGVFCQINLGTCMSLLGGTHWECVACQRGRGWGQSVKGVDAGYAGLLKPLGVVWDGFAFLWCSVCVFPPSCETSLGLSTTTSWSSDQQVQPILCVTLDAFILQFGPSSDPCGTLSLALHPRNEQTNQAASLPGGMQCYTQLHVDG